MKIWTCFLLLCVLPTSLASVARAQPLGDHQAARHKPGPVTLRGIAIHVHAHDFTLETSSHGSFLVTTTSATEVTEKGKRGQVSLREGDHVGVRGFVTGQKLRAILVRIYPIKPKPYTLRGVVSGAEGSSLLLEVNGKSERIQVGSATSIRIGSGLGSLHQIALGDRVEIRVQPSDGKLLALTIHVYRPKAPNRHVELRGTATSVSGSVVTVRSGVTTYRVSYNGQTAIYVGDTRSSSHALHAGQAITIHACCAGQPLVATSIHLRKEQVKRKLVLLQGRVTAVTDREIHLATSRGNVGIILQPSTRYEVGSAPADRGNVRVGDEVSVRAYASGRSLAAERVHVYESYRRERTVTGTVLGASKTGIVVAAAGKRYTVTVGSGTTVDLNGRRAAVSSLHAGDRVRVTGHLGGGGSVAASRVAARRAAPKLTTIRGVVSSVSGSNIVIVDDFGSRHTVRLMPGARVRLHGQAAPSGALFPGVKASARGYLSAGMLAASTLTLTVTERRVRGTVTSVTRSALVLRSAAGETARIDLPAGVGVADGAKQGGSSLLQVGAEVKVDGYAEPSGAVRAARVSILHPTLALTATVTANAGGLTVRTSRGQTYRLRFSPSSEISTGRVQINLSQRDIPVGARVHLHGRLGSDGTVAVDQIVVHLTTRTLQGSIRTITGSTLTIRLEAGESDVPVRSTAATTFAQGSQSLGLSDLVAGDAVTVYGYSLGKGIVLARKILVHRRLRGLDGTVSSLSSDGFVLTAADGDHHVLLSSATIWTGGTSSDLAVGTTLHVTGYERGDGAVLATRVRLRRKRP